MCFSIRSYNSYTTHLSSYINITSGKHLTTSPVHLHRSDTSKNKQAVELLYSRNQNCISNWKQHWHYFHVWCCKAACFKAICCIKCYINTCEKKSRAAASIHVAMIRCLLNCCFLNAVKFVVCLFCYWEERMQLIYHIHKAVWAASECLRTAQILWFFTKAKNVKIFKELVYPKMKILSLITEKSMVIAS